MKKLTLLMAMLMATSAWAETKHLTCAYEEVDEEERVEVLIEIAFDLELQIFEINFEMTKKEDIFVEAAQGDLTVFPTFLSFLFIMEGEPLKIDINREDLMAKFYEPRGEYPSRTIVESIKCQLVRGKKNQI